MYKKSQEKLEEVLRMYQEGQTIRQIRLAVGSSEKTVKNILLSQGIDSVADRASKLDKVIELYETGHSQLYIEQVLKMTRKTIRELLKSKDVDYRSKSEQWRIRYGNTLREDAFDTITPDSAYWIGMLYTDGHIGSGKRGYNIEFGLHEQDKEHLQKYIDFLGSSNSIQDDKRGCYCRVRIGSQKLFESLQKLGFTNQKSYDAVPHKSVQNSRDFWRGCIDGDGGVYTPYSNKGVCQLSLSGTLDTICGFITFCQDNLFIGQKKYPTRLKGRCLYGISFYAGEAIAIANCLYKDSITYLERKYQKYLQIIGDEQNTPYLSTNQQNIILCHNK